MPDSGKLQQLFLESPMYGEVAGGHYHNCGESLGCRSWGSGFKLP